MNIRPATSQQQTDGARLSEGIQTQSLEEIQTYLRALITSRSVVSISVKGRKWMCISHSHIFPYEGSLFSQNSIFMSFCNNHHIFCFNCVLYYISNNISIFYLNNFLYECMFCKYLGIEGSQMFDYSSLRYFAVQTIGEQHVFSLENYSPNKPNIGIQNQCKSCSQNFSSLIMICSSGDQICKTCLEKFLLNFNQSLDCFIQGCKGSVYIRTIIEKVENERILQNLKPIFEIFGFTLDFCPKCKKRVEINFGPDGKKTDTRCKCGKRICNYCKRIYHYGRTCFYFESNRKIDVILLKAPKIIDKPADLKEQEYLNAKYAFENFIHNSGFHFKQAKLIVNKDLEDRYSAKKQEMAKQCGGENKVNEIYVWHGSAYENYQKIVNTGLVVGGVDVPIANANVHGYGIYCSITPDTPIGYAQDSKWIVACLALKGLQSPVKIDDVSMLNTGKYHSYKPKGEQQKDWQVIFTKEQILPRFLVKYS